MSFILRSKLLKCNATNESQKFIVMSVKMALPLIWTSLKIKQGFWEINHICRQNKKLQNVNISIKSISFERYSHKCANKFS